MQDTVLLQHVHVSWILPQLFEWLCISWHGWAFSKLHICVRKNWWKSKVFHHIAGGWGEFVSPQLTTLRATDTLCVFSFLSLKTKLELLNRQIWSDVCLFCLNPGFNISNLGWGRQASPPPGFIRQFKHQTYIQERNVERTTNPKHAICHTLGCSFWVTFRFWSYIRLVLSLPIVNQCAPQRQMFIAQKAQISSLIAIGSDNQRA